MQVIPLQAVANQTLSVVLAGQNVSLMIQQNAQGVFVSVSIAGTAIVNGVLALDRNLIVRESDGSFIGDLSFFDTQGFSDPDYSGFGSRYLLAYLGVDDGLY